MKRNFFRLLVSAVLMTCCTVMAWAGLGTPPDDEIWYTTINDEILNADFSEVFGSEVISNTYENGKGVIKLEKPITKIGDHAFNGYSRISHFALKSISLPNSVKIIGYSAFYWQDNLTEISLGNSVETISDEAFRECDGLKTIAIPASVTSIGKLAFEYCSNIERIEWDSNVSPSCVTQYCKNKLTSVILGNSIISIGNKAFYGCSGLTSIEIPNSVTSIGGYAFYYCNYET